MLPKKFRLPRERITSVRSDGKRLHSGNIDVRFLPGSDLTPRFAVVVPLKVDKRAVARNRIKRLIHEKLHMMLGQFPVVDVICFVRQRADRETLNRDIENVMMLTRGQIT
jgi:ribonuclease P protein component